MELQEEQRYTEAFKKHYSAVYRYLFAKLRNQADAQDLAQLVFIAMYHKWPRVKNLSDHKLHYWLMSAARLQLADYVRTNTKKPAQISIDCLPESTDHTVYIQNFEEEILSESLSESNEELLELALNGMSQNDILLYHSVYTNHIPYTVLAKELGISEVALRSRICRMRIRLQDRIHKIVEQHY